MCVLETITSTERIRLAVGDLITHHIWSVSFLLKIMQMCLQWAQIYIRVVTKHWYIHRFTEKTSLLCFWKGLRWSQVYTKQVDNHWKHSNYTKVFCQFNTHRLKRLLIVDMMAHMDGDKFQSVCVRSVWLSLICVAVHLLADTSGRRKIGKQRCVTERKEGERRIEGSRTVLGHSTSTSPSWSQADVLDASCHRRQSEEAV